MTYEYEPNKYHLEIDEINKQVSIKFLTAERKWHTIALTTGSNINCELLTAAYNRHPEGVRFMIGKMNEHLANLIALFKSNNGDEEELQEAIISSVDTEEDKVIEQLYAYENYLESNMSREDFRVLFGRETRLFAPGSEPIERIYESKLNSLMGNSGTFIVGIAYLGRMKKDPYSVVVSENEKGIFSLVEGFSDYGKAYKEAQKIIAAHCEKLYQNYNQEAKSLSVEDLAERISRFTKIWKQEALQQVGPTEESAP